MVSDDRPRGILSPADRKYLRSDKSGYTRQAQHKRNEAIRQRVQNAILDMSVLHDHWPAEEREAVFGTTAASGEFGEGLAALLGLVYAETNPNGRFKSLLSRGINDIERQRAAWEGYRVQVAFDVTPVTSMELGPLVDKVSRRGLAKLSDEEVLALFVLLRETNTLTPDDFAEMREDLRQQLPDFEKTAGEAHRRRAKVAREEQARSEPER